MSAYLQEEGKSQLQNPDHGPEQFNLYQCLHHVLLTGDKYKYCYIY